MRANKLSYRQFMALIFVGILSPAIRILPQESVKLAGKEAWLAPIIIIIPAVLYIKFVFHILEKRQTGEGLAEVINRWTGKVPGTIINFIFAVWFICYAGFLLRTAADRLVSTIYENGNIAVFIIMLAVISAIAAAGKVRSLGRTAEIFLPIIGVVLILTLALSFTGFDIKNVLPINISNIKGIAAGAVPIINITGITSLFIFVSKDLELPKNRKKTEALWIIGFLLVIFFLMLCCIGEFGTEISTKTNYPYFMLVRNISIYNVVEHIEAVVVVLWCVTDFIYVSVMLYSATFIVSKGIKRTKRKILVLPISAATAVIALVIPNENEMINLVSDKIVPVVNLLVVFVLIPLIYVVGRLRKRV